jgi:predicted PurR-regulated permease PerM
LLGLYFVREGVQATQDLPNLVAVGRLEWLSRAWMWIAQRTGQSDADLASLLQNAARATTAFLAGSLGGILRNVVVLFFDLFVTVFALFYFLRDSDVILQSVRRLLPFDKPLREEMLKEVQELIHASVTVSLLIALVQGSINGSAFALAGIGQPLFWGLIMTFLSLLPVVGAWPVWVPVAIWLFATGQIGRGLVLLVLCGGVAGTVDNILRPMLLSGRTRLSSLAVFISVLGGIALFGMIGFVLGPIIFALVQSLFDVYTRRPRLA